MYCEAQAGKCTWETLTLQTCFQKWQQSQMSCICIRLEGADTFMVSLVVFSSESIVH